MFPESAGYFHTLSLKSDIWGLISFSFLITTMNNYYNYSSNALTKRYVDYKTLINIPAYRKCGPVVSLQYRSWCTDTEERVLVNVKNNRQISIEDTVDHDSVICCEHKGGFCLSLNE